VNSREITWKDYLFPPLHPEGPGFLAVFAFSTFILWLIWSPLGLVGGLLTGVSISSAIRIASRPTVKG
jgi:hypothetical protein